MKSIETNKWCIGTSWELFFNSYDSREEAIKALKDDYDCNKSPQYCEKIRRAVFGKVGEQE